MINVFDQILIALIAILSVGEEWYATYPYRQNIAPKTKESRLYHRWGFFLIGVMCFSLAFLPLLLCVDGYTRTNAFRLLLLNCAIYWNLFDMGYSLLLTKWRTPFYLGDEATLDEKTKTFLGKYAGRIKAILLIGFITWLNLKN